MMATGSSPRGLSEVSTTTSLPAPAARPIKRPFASITIAAAAEHGDHPAASLAHKLAGHGDDVAQSVVGVGVVDDHSKILPAVD